LPRPESAFDLTELADAALLLGIPQPMLVHAQAGSPQLNYRRHFTILALLAAVLVIPALARPWHELRNRFAWHAFTGYDAEFALLGLLHALAVVASLRRRPPLWRPLIFVVAAALLNVGVLHMGYALLRAQTAPISSAPAILIPACLGAAAYALLTRLLLRFRVAWIALAPAACLAGSLAGMVVARLWSDFTALMIGWWFAFSAWLYCADLWLELVRRVRATQSRVS
jgi:hypothetical protein